MEQCENINKCGFFLNYKNNSEVVKQSWVKLFCENRVKSENCERKKIMKRTGKAAIDNMTPTGKII